MNKPTITTNRILQTGLGFWASKTLLAANDLGVFDALAATPTTGPVLGRNLGLHPRSLYDFLDALVALKFLDRRGEGEAAVYTNTSEVAAFLVKSSPAYVGGMLSMANHRLYPFWNDLETALRTGLPQNESKNNGTPVFELIYADPAKLREFIAAMTSIQVANFHMLSQKFDFSEYQTVCDLGGAGGALCLSLARGHEHLNCTSFDLPPVLPVARENIEAAGLSKRVTPVAGDFFEDALPSAEVFIMGNILHDWNEQEKRLLIQRAYDALPAGGAFIAIENVIDDERRENTFGLLMSLNMLIETTGGFDYTFSDFQSWATAAGFQRTELIPLAGPSSAVVAYK
jgi:hypothetical protein